MWPIALSRQQTGEPLVRSYDGSTRSASGDALSEKIMQKLEEDIVFGRLRVLLEMASMSDTPEEEGAEGDVDHGLGDVEALLVVSHEASPAHHPSEGSLYDPSTGQDMEALGAFDPADHLDDEVEEGGLVHQRSPIIGAVGKEMFDPGPALADRVENRLAAGRVRDVRRRQIDQKQPAIGIYGNVTLAADDLLGRVEAARLGRRGLDRLAVYHGGRGARLSPRTLAVHHQPLELLSDLGHAAARFGCPHGQLESRPHTPIPDRSDR